MPDVVDFRLQFNQAQTDALDLSSDILLTATAGSGKTTVLIERFLRILEHNDYKPEQIVAITFADEAARQMRERIRGAIESRLSQTSENPSANQWERALGHLPRSPITTIHGFCYRLLRDDSLHRHLDSELDLLKPSRQQLLAVEAVRQSLRDSSRRGNRSLKKLLHYLPQSRLEEFFKQLLDKRHHLSVKTEPDENWLRDLYLQETATVLLRAPDWEEFLQLLRSLPENLLNHPNSFSMRCRRQLELLQTRSSLDPRSFIESFQLTLESRAVPTPEWRHQNSYPRIVSTWKQLKKLISKRTRLDPCTGAATRHFRRALQCVQELHAEIVRCYERKKRSAGGLDFEDLVVSAARLVRKREVVDLIQERFRFFLIDEFQDTNELQWKVLRPLMGSSSNLLVVGDPKQSIYRFRNADVSIFRRVQNWIRRDGRIVEMPENYRAARELVHFCNHLFQNLFSGDLEYEASHQDMVVARPDSPSGRIESCLFRLPPETPSATTPEPDLVATAVQQLKRKGYAYSDIAILLRARTRLKAYEDALRLRDIPFHTIGGIGFYQRQEILDLLNLLRFLSRTSNDTALVGVLRSPIFSLSDEDLLTLSRIPGKGYWEKLGNSINDESGAPKHWHFARERLNSWLQRDPAMLTSDLLQKVLKETGFLAILQASRRGEQAQQNVRKLLAVVVDIEAAEGIYLRQVVRSLESLTRSDPYESESEVLRPGQEAVRILTIHGAKGLQFRAVVFPELGRKLSNIRKDRFVAESFGSGSGRISYLGFRIRNPSNQYKHLRHPVYQMLSQLRLQRQLAEEKRLLYVALTRAEDHLILIGKRTTDESYARWLQDSGAANLTKTSSALKMQAQNWLEGRFPLDSEPASPFTETSPWEPSQSQFGEKSESYRPSAGRFFLKYIWSPTEMSRFYLCPRRFLLGKILRYSELGPFDTTANKPIPALFGEVVHDLIEKARNVGDVDEVDAHLRRWDRTLRSRLVNSKASFEDRVKDHLKTVAGNRIYHEMLRASSSYREREFRVKLGRREISGVFDGIYKRDGEGWVVVDFKTVELGGRPASEIAANRGFRLQVELYLWAASRILGSPALKGFIVFTASGESVEVAWSARLNKAVEKSIGKLPVIIHEEAFPLTTQASLCRDCGFKPQGLCPGVA